jgi:hypothetical protein
MNPLLFALLAQTATGQFPPWLQNLMISPAVWSGVTTAILGLLGFAWHAEQARQHAEQMAALIGLEQKIFEKADKRYVRLPQQYPVRVKS